MIESESYIVNIEVGRYLKLSLYSLNRLFFPYSNFYDQKWLIKNFNWSVKYDASLFFYRFPLKSVPEFPLRSRFRNFQQQKRFKRFRILFHNGHVSRNNTVNATHFTLFRSSFTRVRHFVTQWKPAVSPVNYPTVRGLREIDALLNNFRCLADAWYIEYVMRGCEWSNDVSFLTGVVRGSVNLLCFLFFPPLFSFFDISSSRFVNKDVSSARFRVNSRVKTKY